MAIANLITFLKHKTKIRKRMKAEKKMIEAIK